MFETCFESESQCNVRASPLKERKRETCIPPSRNCAFPSRKRALHSPQRRRTLSSQGNVQETSLPGWPPKPARSAASPGALREMRPHRFERVPPRRSEEAEAAGPLRSLPTLRKLRRGQSLRYLQAQESGAQVESKKDDSGINGICDIGFAVNALSHLISYYEEGVSVLTCVQAE